MSNTTLFLLLFLLMLKSMTSLFILLLHSLFQHHGWPTSTGGGLSGNCGPFFPLQGKHMYGSIFGWSISVEFVWATFPDNSSIYIQHNPCAVKWITLCLHVFEFCHGMWRCAVEQLWAFRWTTKSYASTTSHMLLPANRQIRSSGNIRQWSAWKHVAKPLTQGSNAQSKKRQLELLNLNIHCDLFPFWHKFVVYMGDMQKLLYHACCKIDKEQ